MEIIISPRGGGKTTRLIELADGQKGYIVCSDLKRCSEIYHQAVNLGRFIHYPITYKQLINLRLTGLRDVEIFIDDVDRFLVSFIPMPIKAITLTKNPEGCPATSGGEHALNPKTSTHSKIEKFLPCRLCGELVENN